MDLPGIIEQYLKDYDLNAAGFSLLNQLDYKLYKQAQKLVSTKNYPSNKVFNLVNRLPSELRIVTTLKTLPSFPSFRH